MKDFGIFWFKATKSPDSSRQWSLEKNDRPCSVSMWITKDGEIKYFKFRYTDTFKEKVRMLWWRLKRLIKGQPEWATFKRSEKKHGVGE